MSHASNERVEHINIIITSPQEADNVIPNQDRCGLSLSNIQVRLIKTAVNKKI